MNNAKKYFEYTMRTPHRRPKSPGRSKKGGGEVEDFFAKATAHELKPVIVNPESKFVVVTYWWGRGNLNKNTQRPCPEELKEGQELSKQPMKYDAMIDKWVESCKKHKCNYLVEEYPEFAVKGGYQHAINFKPHFIDLALEACSKDGRGVLYIDGDMHMKMYPKVFDIPDIDYMCRGWNTDPRAKPNKKNKGKKNVFFCFDAYLIEMSGGTMFFGNTFYGRKLLKMWQTETLKYPGKADDRILSLVVNKYNLIVPMTIIQLPVEYLWMDLFFEDFLSNKGRYQDYSKTKLAITHPECLTGEERAGEEGAVVVNNDRNPEDYVAEVEDHIMCPKWFWEEIYVYVHFPSKDEIQSFSTLFNWIERKMGNNIEIIPYDDKYGRFNPTADENDKLVKTVEISKEEVVKISGKSIEERMVIPTILAHLLAGKDVVYSHEDHDEALVKKVIDTAHDQHVEFVAKNISEEYEHGKPEWWLTVDFKHPLFFSHKSETIKHWLRMSHHMSGWSKKGSEYWHQCIEQVFDRSYLFLTRIRCHWIV